MRLYLGIDGTANDDKGDVIPACVPLETLIAAGGGNSHVKQMSQVGFGAHKYLPGTRDKMTGQSSAEIITYAMGWIDGAYGSTVQEDKQLYLGGFSRGGAAIVVIAHLLAEKNIPIQEMYIFDAVDRSFSMNNSKTGRIPGNVSKAYHAMRHPASGSRDSFGNCGTVGTNGNLETQYFMTTHGGVGGWPNGEEMVKPGFGPEDLAYVSTYGLAGGAAKVMTDPRQKKIHENMEPFPSTISPKQEITGAERALAWMRGKAFTSMRRSAGM
jgi:hypothetical protein